MICLLISALTMQAQDYVSLSQRAEESLNNNRLEEAVKYGRLALEAARSDSGSTSLAYARAMGDLGVYLYYNFQSEEGISYLQSSCALKEKILGSKHPDYILSLSDLGSLYYIVEDYHSSMEIFLQSADLLKEISGQSSLDYGYELNKLALAQTALGRYPDANINLMLAMRIFKDQGMKGTADYASLLNNIASLYQSQGRYLSAERNYNEASGIYFKLEGEDSPNYAVSLQNLGNLLAEMGRYEEALARFEEVSEIKMSGYGDDHPEYARALNDMANVYQHLGNYVQSEISFLESLEIKKAHLGIEHPSYHRTLNNIAMLNFELGRADKAENLLLPVYEFHRSQRHESPLSFIIYAQNLAEIYRSQKKFDEAETLLEEVLLMLEESTGKKHFEYAMAMHNVAGLKMENEQWGEAEEIQAEALEIIRNSGQSGSINELAIIFQAGMIFLNTHEYQKSEALLMKSAKLARKLLNPKNPEFNNYIVNLAFCFEKQGKFDEAEPLYIEAMENIKQRILTGLSFMSSSEKEQYLNRLDLHIALFNAFAIKRSTTNPDILVNMYDVRLMVKSMILESIKQKRRLLFEEADVELQDQFIKWLGLKEYLNKLYQVPYREIMNSGVNLDSIENVADQMEKRLAYDLDFLNNSNNYKNYEWETVVKSLSHDEAAIELIRIPFYGSAEENFEVWYAALITTSDSRDVPDLVILPYGRELDTELSDSYLQNLFGKEEDTNTYKYFWSDIAKKIHPYKTIYLSRDGIYNILNVNTFKNRDNQQYVIENWDIHLVGNTGQLVRIKQMEEDPLNKGAAYLFGYPDYSMDISQTLTTPGGLLDGENQDAGSRRFGTEYQYLSDLPGTKKEVETIYGILQSSGWDPHIYLEQQAGEKQLKEIRNPQILHLATHGFFDFVISRESVYTMERRKGRNANPLLRSGIMLAGSSNTLKLVKEDIPFMADLEDGILCGFEATNLLLDKTELVVLSACLSGVGESRLNDTESYQGMLRAFLAAGASSVIASCWSVDDDATYELMVSFYEEWMLTGKRREAFRNAQLRMMEKYEKPFYWGAFIMVGD